MAYKIAFYDTKPYDEHSFTEANEKFGFDIRYYKGHLNMMHPGNIMIQQVIMAWMR